MTPLEHALALISDGFAPIPVGHRQKRPSCGNGWESLRITVETAPQYFNGKPQNVGAHMGEASHGLVDVDLDCRESLVLAPLLLPATRGFGRPSKLHSHRIYRATENIPGAVARYKDPIKGADGKNETLVELRSTGGQTVMPGSTHESGEPITWDSDEPYTDVDGNELTVLVRELAAACLLSRHFPGLGSRHDARLALAGGLLRAGWKVDTADSFMSAIMSAVGANVADCRVCLDASKSKLDRGAASTGWKTLAGMMDPKVVSKVREWLGATGQSNVPEHDAETGEVKTSAPTRNGWESRLVCGERGVPAVGLGNVSLILANHPAFKARVAHNEFSHLTEVVKPLPWDKASGFAPREWGDNDDVRAASWMQLEYRFAPSTRMVAQAVTSVAAECAYHPVRARLNSYSDGWDGTERINNLFLTYFAARTGDEQTDLYLAAVGRRFLISTVARIMRPGCKVDTVPIIDGPQGALKSTGLRALFEPWFTDELSTPGGKDADEQLRGVWVVELAELEQFDRAEATRMKGFISRQEDRFRWSYGTRVQAYPRQNVFVGTTNVADWGRDETGARRFWPVSVRGPIDAAGIRRDQQQLLGEAVRAYRAGEQWHLTPAEERLARAEQDDRRQVDALESPVVEYLAGRASATMPEILANVLGLGSDKSKWDQRIQNQVAKIFRTLGWEKRRARTAGTREWRYCRPDPIQVRVVQVAPDLGQTRATENTEKTSPGLGVLGGPSMITHARTPARLATQCVADPGCAIRESPEPGWTPRPRPEGGPGDEPADLSPAEYLDRLLPRSDA